MPGSNNGTGWPITVRCAKCKVASSRMDRGTRLVRTGRTKPYNKGNKGVRGLLTFHEYLCIVCGHIGWSRHVDIVRKPERIHG